MKVDELIEELNKFKEEYGNLEVGIARINSTDEEYEDVAYYKERIILIMMENTI